MANQRDFFSPFVLRNRREKKFISHLIPLILFSQFLFILLIVYSCRMYHIRLITVE